MAGCQKEALVFRCEGVIVATASRLMRNIADWNETALYSITPSTIPVLHFSLRKKVWVAPYRTDIRYRHVCQT